MLAGLQFENGQPACASDGEYVEDSVFAAGIGENLGVGKTRIERRIDARNVGAHQGFQPPFGLCAIKRMARVGGQRLAMEFELVQQSLQGGTRSGGEFLFGLADSEVNAAVVPACERQSTETQPDFARLRRGMHGDSARCEAENRVDCGPGLGQKRFRFAMCNEPGVDIARTPWIDFL